MRKLWRRTDESETDNALVDAVTNSLAIMIVLVTITLIVQATTEELAGSVIQHEDAPELFDTRVFSHFRPLTTNFVVDTDGVHAIAIDRLLAMRDAAPRKSSLQFSTGRAKLLAFHAEDWDLDSIIIRLPSPPPPELLITRATWEDGAAAVASAILDIEPGFAPYLFVHPDALGQFGEVYQELRKAEGKFRWRVTKSIGLVRSPEGFRFNAFFL